MEKELELGKKVEAPKHYSPESLRRVERNLERKPQLEKFETPLQSPGFFGVDVWNCYEFSFLNAKGQPCNYLLKIIYSASSAYIVESKSLKLYLGSFAMCRYPDVETVLDIIEKDLDNLLETHVEIIPGYAPLVSSLDKPVSTYPENYACLDLLSVGEVTEYTHSPELLEVSTERPKDLTMRVYSLSLRSNCKVTHQPDYGTVFIGMRGPKLPTPKSLLKYLISFRGENHFHEEIVETIFMDLQRIFKPTNLEVLAKYTRRGGIDINPYRTQSIKDLRTSDLLSLELFKPGMGRTIMQ